MRRQGEDRAASVAGIGGAEPSVRQRRGRRHAKRPSGVDAGAGAGDGDVGDLGVGLRRRFRGRTDDERGERSEADGFHVDGSDVDPEIGDSSGGEDADADEDLPDLVDPCSPEPAGGDGRRGGNSSDSHFSFFNFLSRELNLVQTDTSDPVKQRQRVYNFLVLPFHLERLFFFGFGICLDIFLFVFTYLPFRVLYALRVVFSPLTCRRVRLGRREKCDILQGIVMLACFVALNYVNMSRLYHFVRGQSVLKLYVLFNMLGIVDRMCTSFGEDILDAMYGSVDLGYLRIAFHTMTALTYTFLHSLVLFGMVITLNVSVNSNNNSLAILLVSNNFMELKSTVFKRFRIQNLFQVTCSDIVERFQLACFVMVIVIQNIGHIGLDSAEKWLRGAGLICSVIFCSECVVDWIKHGFLTKFNMISPSVYHQFDLLLCHDFVATHSQKRIHLHTHDVPRRIGLISLPYACLSLRVVYQAVLHSSMTMHMKCVFVAVTYVILLSLKMFLSICLLGHSAKHVLMLEEQKNVAQETGVAMENDVSGVEELANTERYALVGNRIP